MAGLATQAFTIGGGAASLVAFLTAATVMVILMFSISAAVATAQEGVLSALKASGSQVKQWGALLMLGVGMLILATSAWPWFFIPFLTTGS